MLHNKIPKFLTSLQLVLNSLTLFQRILTLYKFSLHIPASFFLQFLYKIEIVIQIGSPPVLLFYLRLGVVLGSKAEHFGEGCVGGLGMGLLGLG